MPTAWSPCQLVRCSWQQLGLCCTQGVYFTFIKLLEGHPNAISSMLAAKFWPTLAANWCIWPLAHLINFKYVPPAFRIL
jgi:hypothetical protein